MTTEPSLFDEIEFALNNPEAGTMNDGAYALEVLRIRIQALEAVAVAAALEHADCRDLKFRTYAGFNSLERALASLAALGGSK